MWALEEYRTRFNQRHLGTLPQRDLDEIRSRLFSRDFAIRSHLFSVLVAADRPNGHWRVDHPAAYGEIAQAIFGSSPLPVEGEFANPLGLAATTADGDAIAGLLKSAETDQIAAEGVFRSMLRTIRAAEPAHYAY